MVFILSQLGCQLFSLVGLVPAHSCEALGGPANTGLAATELDSMMWFKLLFVPMLGLIILTLFLLEDHCYSYQDTAGVRLTDSEQSFLLGHRKKEGDGRKVSDLVHHHHHHHSHALCAVHSSPASSNGIAKSHRTRSRSATTESAAVTKHSHSHCTCGYSPNHFTNHLSSSLLNNQQRLINGVHSSPHLLYLSESNQATAYTFSPTLTLRDLILFHSHRHNLIFDPIIVWIDGHRIDVQSGYNETLEKLNLYDGSIIKVETDYSKLIDIVRVENEKRIKETLNTIAQIRRRRIEKQCQAELLAKLPDSTDSDHDGENADDDSGNEVIKEYNDTQARKAALAVELATQLQLLTTAQSRLVALNESLSQAELQSQSTIEKNEKSAVESKLARIQSEWSEVTREKNELIGRVKKVNDELGELAGKCAEISVKSERVLKERETWRKKVHESESVTQQRLESFERAKEEFVKLKNLLDLSEREKEELRAIKYDLTREIVLKTESLEKDIAKTAVKIRAIEDESVELLKYKQTFRLYEAEVKELVRLKLLLKQGKIREKMLEKDIKELIHWRQKSKAFEREMKLLKQWKKEFLKRENFLIQNNQNLAYNNQFNEQFHRALGFHQQDSSGDYSGTIDGSAGGVESWTMGSVNGNEVHYTASAGSDAVESVEDIGDEAAIPPIDIISSATASRQLHTLPAASVNSTLQPTAAPFVPRTTVAQPASAATPQPSASNYSSLLFSNSLSHPSWSTTTQSLQIIDDSGISQNNSNSHSLSLDSATSAALSKSFFDSFPAFTSFPSSGLPMNVGEDGLSQSEDHSDASSVHSSPLQ